MQIADHNTIQILRQPRGFGPVSSQVAKEDNDHSMLCCRDSSGTQSGSGLSEVSASFFLEKCWDSSVPCAGHTFCSESKTMTAIVAEPSIVCPQVMA